MGRLVEKSKLLTGYLFYVLDEINSRFSSPVLEAITPRGEDEHGCQVSIIMKQHGREIFEGLLKQGVISDWREPDVIRVAPVPLYNSFSDIFRFGTILLGECDRLHQA
jgi:kynureninase